VEDKLLSKVIAEKALPDRVEERHFQRSQKIYIFIRDYYREYGVTPTAETVVEFFPDFICEHTPEPMEYYENSIIQSYNASLIRGAIYESADAMEKNNMDVAIMKLHNAITNIEEKGMQDISIDDMSTLALYETEKRVGGFHTGVSRYDELLNGVYRKELHIIAGRAKVGKTMLMLKIAHEMYLKGANIIFISKEMSADKLVQRFDAIHNNIPLGNIRQGILSFVDKENISNSRKEFAARDNKCLFLANEALDRTSTVWSIVGKIQKYKPDVVFVDSFYLFSDGGKHNDVWVRVGNVANDLADIARRCNVCMFGSTQLNRQVSEKENNVSYKSMGYSDTIIQVSNSVTTLYQNPDMRDRNILEASIIATRDGETGTFNLDWNFHDGCIIEVIDEEYDDEEVVTFD